MGISWDIYIYNMIYIYIHIMGIWEYHGISYIYI